MTDESNRANVEGSFRSHDFPRRAHAWFLAGVSFGVLGGVLLAAAPGDTHGLAAAAVFLGALLTLMGVLHAI